MKLITYKQNNKISYGILLQTGVIDIPSKWNLSICAPKSMLELLQYGPTFMDQVREFASKNDTIIPLSQIELLAPIQRPGKIIGLAGNYQEHIKESGHALGLTDCPQNNTVPRLFLMPSTVIIGTEEEIPWPVYSEEIDYELELAVVIGRYAKCIPKLDALNYVVGYTIANDISARSITFKENRSVRPWDEFFDWLIGKWSDCFCPQGPYILTADEVEDVQNLSMELKVNGHIRQVANTSQMIWSVPDIISFVSHIIPLEPGDIIVTGTPKGVGMASKTYLKPGDIMELSIDKLGILRNAMGAYPKNFYKPL